MRRRGGILAVLATWLAVVIVGATAVWAVISRAGEELVTGSAQPGLGGVTSSAAPTSIATGPTLEQRPRKSRTAQPGNGAGGGSTSPSAAASSSPPTGDTSPSPGTSPAPPPAPSSRTETWNGKPGTVTLACRADGTRGQYSVYARGGWEAETEQEDSGLEVHFRRQDADGEVELKASCDGGRPRFEVHEDDD